MVRKISLICATSLLISCASNQLVIDPKSSANPENFYSDKVECENIAEQESYSQNILSGALLKGIITALGTAGMTALGVGSGANLDIATAGALGLGAGAVAGGGVGAYETYSDRKEIIKKCMQGRGYTILK